MTPTPPAVTAVIPTHRRPELMREAVASVLAQDYAGEIEVVVVFDGCAVDDPQLPAVEGRTVRLVANSRPPGLAGARNTGILAASHGLVAFLDDDDTWRADKLTQQVAHLEAAPDAVLVGSAMVVDDGRTRHVRRVPFTSVSHADLVVDRIAALHSSSLLFRRDALVERIGLIDEDLPGGYGEDYDILLRTARLGPIAVVNEPLVVVRWTGHSYFYGRWDVYAEALQHLLRKHPELVADRRALGRIQSQIAFALAAAGLRAESRSWAQQALRVRRTNARALLALLVSYRAASAPAIARAANLAGRGI